jgi:hypothetical protein
VTTPEHDLVILAALGVPLWLCTIAILTLLSRNRAIRHRPGNTPVRIHRTGSKRWTRGHAVWAHDVFAFRGSPAAWTEELQWISELQPRPATEAELHKLRRLDEPVVATFTSYDTSRTFEVATPASHRLFLLGPLATASDAM